MTDVVGLGLVTSSTTTRNHTSYTSQTYQAQNQTQTPSKWQQKAQNQHLFRSRNIRRSSSSLLSTSSTSPSTTKTATPNTTTAATTKRRITRAAAATAKAAEEREKNKEKGSNKAGKMSTITTTGTGFAAASSSTSSSSRHSSNSTTPTSPLQHHQPHSNSHYSHQHTPHQQQQQHQQQQGQQQQHQYSIRSHPTSHPSHPSHPASHQSSHQASYTDSLLAVQHPSSSSSSSADASGSHQQPQLQQPQDSTRLRGPLTRKRAASLVSGKLGDRTKRLSIDLNAARSGTSTRSHTASHTTSGLARETDSAAVAKETRGSGSGIDGPSLKDSRVGADLDTHFVSSLVSGGGGSVGSIGGGSVVAGSAGGGQHTGGHSGGGPPQRDLICLCTPAPKVPRPRNAFILYRQHHQARVVSENPGLTNPEISKIIGEKWRAESDLHKEEWKQLAEEEKLHHQRKYPEYKYQPRRGNKHSAASSVVGVGGLGSNRTSPTTPGGPGSIGAGGLGGIGGSSAGGIGTEHPGRCPNCGGRYIATPRTPSTPFAAAASASAKGSMHGGEGRSAGGGGESAFSAGMDTPRTMEHHASASSRSQQHYGQQHGGYKDHRASVSSQGGYQAYPNRDYHHSQTYHYPTPSHHQQYPSHPLYDMPQEYDVPTPTGTSSKRRRYDSTSMPYRPEREYALQSPNTPYGGSQRHPSVGGHGHSHGHGQVSLHHYPPPPPPTSLGAIGGGGSGSVPPTPGFAPAPAGPPTSTAALSGPASLALSGCGRGPLSNTMAPPPRPPTLSVPGSSSGSYHHGQQHPASSGSCSGLSPVRMRGDDSVFDPSLRLPPLQTHLAHLSPHSPESGSSSSGAGAGAGLISAGGGGIGLGITYPGGDHRDPRSASSGGSHPYPRLTGSGTAGNTPTAASFPASYHQGAHPHPHHTQQAPTSTHPSWATLYPGQREQQQAPRSDPSQAIMSRDNRERGSTTTLPHHPPQTSDSNTKRQLALIEAQQRQQSVEAMVMSIYYVRKASVLRRIGRELPAYGAVADNVDNLSETGDDSAQEQAQIMTTRGPIIAVEGPNKELLRAVSKAVQKALLQLGDCEVRAWVGEGDVWDREGEKEDSEKVKAKKGGDDMEMDDTVIVRGSSSPKSNDGNDRSSSPLPLPLPSTNKNPFSRYLDLMLSWHQKASELTNFVTTPFFSPSSSSSRSSTPLPASQQPSRQSSRHPSHSPSIPGQKLPKLPIALLPLGYSLTYSDRFACTIPIADAYAPVDHWQWMATLWRGIVGPDLTVYVKPVTEEEMMMEGWPPVGVEVKGERLIVVRVVVPSGHGGQITAVEELSGETEKLLAFEVGEWVRAGPFGVRGRGGVARGERETTQVGYEYERSHGYGSEGW
ncbi:hypothetical protein SMACR_07212 [Sordaria macrospora]|uniref:WGS project CABT00000000 data, contig 2.42 n=2 Tax=Sordaria macrospora TaxID=5147 RepID=F7W801_SORMK|nr:uncharacterized protein SMAC_07212 [Sordaria macrospora k-hell]KAA8631530.1 hypothetical protein SMACR_07212 [Sordaria macrospora]WPJ64214.1 hypothetical protein SMAC4_07212 [Sordaria macrospora]CCC13644.1 unnamed protein product [Sordaria macrospora k-hell]